MIGAQGFVGERLAQVLSDGGRAVFAPAKGDPALFDQALGDVFYCAGLTADFDQRPFDTVEAHVSLLSRLLERGRFERLIYLSSTRLYDGLAVAQADANTALSFDPADPRRTYDLSKALGENLTLTRSGGRGAVARLANVYDWRPGSPGFLSEWLLQARTERALTLASSPGIARDYIHLDDVTAGLVAMAAAPGPGIVNLAGGRLTTNAQIAAVLAEQGWRVAFTGTATPPPPPRADIAKLVALGVSPEPVEDGVRRFLREVTA